MTEPTSQPGGDNPFASPQVGESLSKQPPPELGGRMPGSVMLAIGCVIGVIGVAGAPTLWILVAEGEIAWLLVLLMAVLLMLVVDIARKSRQAWSNARYLSGAFGAMSFVLLALLIGIAFDDLTTLLPTLRRRTPRAMWRSNVDFVVFLLTLAAVAASFWTAYVALGRTTARQYFDRICVGCGSTKVKVVDLKSRRYRCRHCSTEW